MIRTIMKILLDRIWFTTILIKIITIHNLLANLRNKVIIKIEDLLTISWDDNEREKKKVLILISELYDVWENICYIWNFLIIVLLKLSVYKFRLQ